MPACVRLDVEFLNLATAALHRRVREQAGRDETNQLALLFGDEAEGVAVGCVLPENSQYVG